MSTFKDLSQIDVSNHLEIKHGGLSYLSWMAAWALAKDYDPGATFHVHTTETNDPFFVTDAGAFVTVTVIIKGQELTEYLPVLDNRNKPLAGDKLNTFDINSAIKRCLVKALAMHGLGAMVYISGEGTALDLGAGLKKEKIPAPKIASASTPKSF
jgi:hypothetical protein